MKISGVTTTQPSSSREGLLVSFCEERGLDLGIAGQAGLYVEESGDYAGWLAIPYPHLTGRWGVRYRRLAHTGGPKYMDVAGADLHLYNPQHLGPQSREVWFTEGEIDALILWQYGVPAIGMSGSTKYGHELFQEAWSLLFKKARVVIAVDNDDAGAKAAADIEKAFRHAERLSLPDGFDINDFHLKDPSGLAREIRSMG